MGRCRCCRSERIFRLLKECKRKGRVHLTTDHEGPEGEQTYNSNFNLDDGGVEGSAPRLGRFTSGNNSCPLYRRLGVPKGIRSPDRPARSESLYRLGHPGSPYQNMPQVLLRLTMPAANVHSLKIFLFLPLLHAVKSSHTRVQGG